MSAVSPGATKASPDPCRYAISPMQHGMLFHHLYDPHSGADVEQMVMRFREPVDVAALSAAWEQTAARHEVLRTSFLWDDPTDFRQQVHAYAPVEIVEVDQRAYLEDRADARMRDALAADRTRGFDLATAPLSRVTIFHRAGDETVVVWTFHHVVLDGRSFPIVLSDFFEAYDAIRAGTSVELAPSVPYRTFIEWLADYDHESAADYWRTTMAGFSTPTPLPIAEIAATGDRSGFGEVRARLDGPGTDALHRVAGEVGVTLNTMMQGAWARLLSIYANESDIVFGSTRACRYGTVAGADGIAGLFINTLPMRVRITESTSLRDWLAEIRAQHVAMREVEHTPLVEVQGFSDISPGTPLFDSILVFETYQLDARLRADVGTGDRVAYELLEQTNYPLLLSVYGGDGLDLRLEFDRSRFDDAMAERMLGHMVSLLTQIPDALDRPVAELHCVDADEHDLLIDTWGTAATNARGPADLVSRWTAQVRQSPASEAIVGVDRALTFAEADTESDALSTRLAAAGAGRGEVVGILLDRSVNALLTILATLKTGAAYVPLDPGYPPDRLAHMITDSGARLLVTDAPLASNHASLIEKIPALTTIRIDHEPIATAADPSAVRAPSSPPATTPESAAYMIYTSGSTGTPKGVVVAHDSLVNHADGVADAYGLGGDDRVLQFAALSFDVAAEELFPTWLAGAAVVLRSEVVASDFDALHEFVAQREVTVVNLPAAYWSAWVDHLVAEPDLALPASLRLVITGSEGVPTRQYRRWTERVGRAVRWLNAYGPTEATITATVHDPAGTDRPPGATMPIGRPIADVSLRILDPRGRPTPLGIPGELHIGGRGVAIGYHDQPELTATRFVDDPFDEDPNGRLYRTGDLARWLPDGTVEFLGRADDQVKVRGFRIELGEIEAALHSLDGVADAAVVARPDTTGDNRLFAHVVAGEGPGDLSADDLRAGLGASLPAYMVPTAFAFPTQLPLAPSGKVDRKALPDLEVVESSDRAHVAPRTDLERELARAWSDVLGIDQPGVNDNFFDVGGNSLTAIRLFTAIRKLTGRQMQLADLFATPTIGALAAALGDDGRTDRAREGDLPPWVFPLKPDGTLTPLFHLGGASVLRNLANHLTEDRPLYALLEQDLDADHFSTSVDEIVPHCIRGLRAVQPHGPYLLAGLCFGGVVALEMARQLRAQGEHVGLTLMIDSFAPGALTLREHTDGDPVAAAADDGTPPPSRPGRNLRPTRIWRKAKQRLWRASWPTLHELSRRSGRPMPDWLRDVEEANTIASDAYVAQPYDGDVTLFIATDKIAQFHIAPLNGWGALVSGDLDLAEVDGGHTSVYDEPNVAHLAAELNTRLDRIPY